MGTYLTPEAREATYLGTGLGAGTFRDAARDYARTAREDVAFKPQRSFLVHVP